MKGKQSKPYRKTGRKGGGCTGVTKRGGLSLVGRGVVLCHTPTDNRYSSVATSRVSGGGGALLVNIRREDKTRVLLRCFWITGVCIGKTKRNIHNNVTETERRN